MRLLRARGSAELGKVALALLGRASNSFYPPFFAAEAHQNYWSGIFVDGATPPWQIGHDCFSEQYLARYLPKQ